MSQPAGSNPEDERARSHGEGGQRKRHFRGYWNFENTKVWAEMFRNRMSCVAIAKEVGADPQTVSTHLKEHGIAFPQGHHRVERQPPKISPELAKLLETGPEAVLRLLDENVWGIAATHDGLEQLEKYCNFLSLPLEMPVKSVAKELTIHRDTVRKWTQGTDQSYLVPRSRHPSAQAAVAWA